MLVWASASGIASDLLLLDVALDMNHTSHKHKMPFGGGKYTLIS